MNRMQKMISKVPAVTAFFWITKVLTTGMGETTSDYLTRVLNPAVAVLLALLALVGSLIWQFSTRKYVPAIYWLAVVMVSIFGTMAADGLHVVLGVPYIASSIFYLVVLALLFYFWHRSEHTLSVHSITTRRREYFYWGTVLATFALGTALGDLSATTFHLGYFAAGIVFAILIAIPAIGYWLFGLNEIFAFWFAYIMTRPLGASFADWAGVSKIRGGLGFGTGSVSLVLLIVIILCVGYLAITHEDVEPARLKD